MLLYVLYVFCICIHWNGRACVHSGEQTNTSEYLFTFRIWKCEKKTTTATTNETANIFIWNKATKHRIKSTSEQNGPRTPPHAHWINQNRSFKTFGARARCTPLTIVDKFSHFSGALDSLLLCIWLCLSLYLKHTRANDSRRSSLSLLFIFYWAAEIKWTKIVYALGGSVTYNTM